jgi:hypothetical protein
VLRAPRVFEQEQLLQPLVRRCTPAPFGRGRQTRYDRSVRHALQLRAEGLAVTFRPYLIETCADETWQLARFPTPREQAALGERMDPTDLEEPMDIRAGSEEGGDFGLIWVEPSPQFNG